MPLGRDVVGAQGLHHHRADSGTAEEGLDELRFEAGGALDVEQPFDLRGAGEADHRDPIVS